MPAPLRASAYFYTG